jgi:hypothetical protein
VPPPMPRITGQGGYGLKLALIFRAYKTDCPIQNYYQPSHIPNPHCLDLP